MSDLNHGYHKAVLLDESVEGMMAAGSGVYLDGTFGAGGHARLALQMMDEDSHLYGFDQDLDAWSNQISDPRFTLVRSNFRYVERFLKYYEVESLAGVLVDLGVSSHQFDVGSRGFSYRFDGPLDMRMNVWSLLTAERVLNRYSEAELVRILSAYGQVRNAKTLAARILERRRTKRFSEMRDFLNLLENAAIGDKQKYYAQVLQAIRIEVNDEFGALERFLAGVTRFLRPGGRLVAISYHSLEDKMVKNFINTGNADGVPSKDEFGKIDRPYKKITKSVILPSPQELLENSRARSAKLRIAERTKD